MEWAIGFLAGILAGWGLFGHRAGTGDTDHRRHQKAKKGQINANEAVPLDYDKAVEEAEMANFWSYDGSAQEAPSEMARRAMAREQIKRQEGGK